MLFDRAVADGIEKSDIAHVVDPVRQQLDHVVREAAAHTPRELGIAIGILEQNAGAWMQSAQWCRHKADQEMEYAQKLRAAMREELRRRGLAYLEAGGFLFTLSADGTGVEIR
jgi:hypothetical protein